LTATSITQLLKSGNFTQETLMVWSHDLVPNEWTKVCNVAELADSSQEEHGWYYLDGSEQKGIFSVAELAAQFQEGLIDGFSLFWGTETPTAEWKPLSELPALRDQIRQPLPGPEVLAEAATGASSQVGSKKRDRDDTSEEGDQKKKKRKRKRKNRKKGFKQSKTNNWVYVSGLDRDITVPTLNEMFVKYGIIDEDVITGGPRIKIYRDVDGAPKGDASVCYLREPSVELAIQMLDEVEYKPGHQLKVSRAQWEKKAGEDTKGSVPKKPEWAKSLTTAEYKKRVEAKRKRQIAKLGWKSTGIQTIMILKNVFTLKQIKEEGEIFKTELTADIRAGCSAFGEVTLVTVCEHNEEGAVIVKFKTSASVVPCVEKMNGRFFGGRSLCAEVWDGYTNYIVKESEETKARREAEFGAWLENAGDDDEEEEVTAAVDAAGSDIPAVDSEDENVLEAYTSKLMDLLMGEAGAALSEPDKDTITQKLDEALDWMQDNRSSLGDNAIMTQKQQALAAIVEPLLQRTGSSNTTVS